MTKDEAGRELVAKILHAIQEYREKEGRGETRTKMETAYTVEAVEELPYPFGLYLWYPPSGGRKGRTYEMIIAEDILTSISELSLARARVVDAGIKSDAFGHDFVDRILEKDDTVFHKMLHEDKHATKV